VKASIN